MPAMSLPATPLPPLSLPESVDAVVALLAAENYVCDRQLGTALFLALKLARPLFLEGAPGVHGRPVQRHGGVDGAPRAAPVQVRPM